MNAASRTDDSASTIAADVTAIAVFALMARIAHNTPEMPLTFGGWLDTMWPFLVGVGLAWTLLWCGVRPQAESGYGGRGLGAGMIVWICAVLVGLTVWGVRHGEVPHWSFMLVATVTSGILLLGWRGIARLRRRRP